MNKQTGSSAAGQMNIQANRLDRAFFRYQQEFEDKALNVLRSGHYILRSELENFEHGFASYLGTKECVGVGNGLDALWIAFRILGIGKGDEVLVQGNTYIASVMGITINGATPVFIEPDEYYNIDASKLEEKITPRTKAILAVHLYGQASNMGPVTEIAKEHSLRVVEEMKDIPFDIKRVYYVYDTLPGVRRGKHSHRDLEQILVCVHGSCRILLDNGREKETVILDRPDEGLYIGPST